MEVPDISKYQYPEGEEVLVAHLLQNSNVDEILNRAESHLFYDAFFREMFELCRSHAQDAGRGTIIPTDIIELIRIKGKLNDEVETYIKHLSKINLATKPTLNLVIDKLADNSNRRRLIMHLYRGLVSAQNDKEAVGSVIAVTAEDLINIEIGGKDKIEVIMRENILERRKQGLIERRNTTPVFTGWDDFDKYLTHGFAPGKFSVIGGRTSMGKSFFKTNVMANMGERKIGVINICPEQGFDSEHDRLDALRTGINTRTMIRIRELPDGDPHFARLKESSDHIAKEWNYACVPTRGITVSGVQAAIRRVRRNGIHPQVVFVDLFDRLADVNVVRDRTATFSAKLNHMEKIAQEEKVHICLLVQIGRSAEEHKDKRPDLRHLKDCGNFEQDADLIFLLYREGYYNSQVEDNMLEVEIAKQRDGMANLVYQFNIFDWGTQQLVPYGLKRVEKQND